GDLGFIQLTGLAADQVTDTRARFLQIITAQRRGHRRDVFTEATQAEGAIERENLDDPADIRRPGKSRGEQGQRHDRDHPGGNAVAAPAASFTIETLFDAV